MCTCGTEVLKVFLMHWHLQLYLSSATNVENLINALMSSPHLNQNMCFTAAMLWRSMCKESVYTGMLDLLFALK